MATKEATPLRPDQQAALEELLNDVVDAGRAGSNVAHTLAALLRVLRVLGYEAVQDADAWRLHPLAP